MTGQESAIRRFEVFRDAFELPEDMHPLLRRWVIEACDGDAVPFTCGAEVAPRWCSVRVE